MRLLKQKVDKGGHEFVYAAEEISKLAIKNELFEYITVGNISKH